MRTKHYIMLFAAFAAIAFIGLNRQTFAVEGVLETQGSDLMEQKPENQPTATLAGGCFWCLESEFRAIDGVSYTFVGYTGGALENPLYENITTGKTGHAEAVEITYNPEKINYEELIHFFLTKAHDPTQLNRQGVDVGTQYRSEIFYHNEEQKEIAERVIAAVNADKVWPNPIVTKLSPAQEFWPGEDYHQQYYEKYEKREGQIHPRVYFKRQKKKLSGE